jgi:predicted permease
MAGIGNDIRFGYRTLLANPGFSAVAILSLALGIGANTAIFSFINTVVLAQLPVRDPASLVLFGEGRRRGQSNGVPAGDIDIFSWRQYQDFKRAGFFADVTGAASYANRVYPSFANSRGFSEGLELSLVSGNYFDMLGIEPAVGRLLDSSMDNTPTPVAVLNFAYWERAFHRDPTIVGQVARIGTRDYTIIGVARRGFFGIRPGFSPDLWIPLTMQPYLPGQADWLSIPSDTFLNVVGRLKPGTTREQAEAAMNVIFQQNMPQYIAALPAQAYRVASSQKARIKMTSAARGLSILRRDFEQPLNILMWVVALVLAIAAANVANLVMAQNARRTKEFALRTAIGASRWQLVRLVLSESVLLFFIGGVLGILIAAAGARVLVHLISTGPRSLPIGFDPDARVLGFTLAVSVATGIFFGIAPALRGTRPDLNSALKESRASMAAPRKVTFGRAMVVGQVALSMALLVGSALLLKSFQNLITKSLGFDREHVLVVQVDTVATGYNGDQKLANLYHRIEARISAIPGVISSAFCHRVFNEGRWTEGFSIPGMNVPRSDRMLVMNFVGPEFFRSLNIPVLRGRVFDYGDNASEPRVAVINETMARTVFGGDDPIGKTIMMSPITDNDVPYQIIGVARDAQDRSVTDAPVKMGWLPLEQNPIFAADVVVRATGDPVRVAGTVRQAIHSTDPNLPIAGVTTLADQVSDSLVTQRAVAQLTAFFAGLALLLAAIGLYGTISFAVARRTGEIGIRMALGAERSTVVGMVLSDAGKLIAAGVVIGLPLAFGATALVRSLLYGIGRFDAASTVLAILVLSACAIVAGYLPARRASRVDPMVALRYE